MYLLCLEPEETYYPITDIQEKKITWLINQKKLPRTFRLTTEEGFHEIVSETILGYTKTIPNLCETPQARHRI